MKTIKTVFFLIIILTLSNCNSDSDLFDSDNIIIVITKGHVGEVKIFPYNKNDEYNPDDLIKYRSKRRRDGDVIFTLPDYTHHFKISLAKGEGNVIQGYVFFNKKQHEFTSSPYSYSYSETFYLSENQ